MSRVAKDAGVSRESLYRMLRGSGNPRYSSLTGILSALGLRLKIEPATTPENMTAGEVQTENAGERTPQELGAIASDITIPALRELMTSVASRLTALGEIARAAHEAYSEQIQNAMRRVERQFRTESVTDQIKGLAEHSALASWTQQLVASGSTTTSAYVSAVSPSPGGLRREPDIPRRPPTFEQTTCKGALEAENRREGAIQDFLRELQPTMASSSVRSAPRREWGSAETQPTDTGIHLTNRGSKAKEGRKAYGRRQTGSKHNGHRRRA